MIIDCEGEKVPTKLQKDDQCVWVRHHGTAFFRRGGTTLRRDNGDDKFLIKPLDLLSFAEIVAMIAESHGLKATLESVENSSANSGSVTYRFV
ncbi:MAG TPA: hypothetical protein VJH55_02095 [Candidatus Paceibacterota bacterium]